MAGTRIANLTNQVTQIVDSDYLVLDNPTTNTSKIKGSDLLTQLQKHIISFNSASLVKLSSGDFDLKSNGYLQFSVSPTLYDGYTLTFTTSGLEYNWQTKTNPTINVDGTGAKPLINGVFYDSNPYDTANGYSSELLDTNTIGNGKHTVMYNATIDKWLLYKDYTTSGTIIASPHNIQLAGMEALNGASHTLGNRPLLELAFPTFGNTTPNLANASLAGVGDETPLGVISEGQVESFTPLEDSKIFGRWDDLFSNATGAFVLGTESSTIGNFPTFTSGTADAQKITLDLSAGFNKTGNETLTRRIGVQFYWVA